MATRAFPWLPRPHRHGGTPTGLLYWLPQGTPLPTPVWQTRHRLIVALLWLHVVGIAGYGLLAHADSPHGLLEALGPLLAAVLASRDEISRPWRARAASVGLLTTSALMVHFSGGYIEMHFHFFVMVAVVTLYQSWAPFLVAIGFVVIHHAIVGALAPEEVYNHPSAWAHPWLWALIHGVFILGASAAGLINWRMNELARAETGRAEVEAGREQEARLAAEREVAERRRHAAELYHQSRHDALTGLPNRTAFMERLGDLTNGGGRRADGMAVLFLDLDRFKVVNDSLGHWAGDRLLVGVAERLAHAMRGGDLAARFGGDEFVVLLGDIHQVTDALTIADRIIRELARPLALGGRELFVGASVGIALRLPGDGPVAADELLRQADVAMYRAKACGRGTAVVFDVGMDRFTPERLELEADLRHAIERDELAVHYQPIVAIATGEVRGMEALIRWEHPRRGVISATELIPLAEETGLIVPLGRSVLRLACRQASRWRELGGHDLRVNVNVSVAELRQPDLVAYVVRVLRETGLPAAKLVLEITESVLMDDDAATAREVIPALRALGVRLAIDDFGTGYSSLSYLLRFPVDTLKIDGSFVAAIGHDDEAMAILRAVTALGRALNIEVIAEGVETAEHLARLRAVGCELGQGHLFAKPAEAIGALLAGRARSRSTTADTPEPRLNPCPATSLP